MNQYYIYWKKAILKNDLNYANHLFDTKIPLAPDENGANPLHVAVVEGLIEMVVLILERAPPAFDVNAMDLFGCTALHKATGLGHLKIIQILVMSGRVQIDIADKINLFTPIHVAAQNGHNEAARILIKAGCNIYSQNQYGDTALHTAVRNGHIGVCKILLAVDMANLQQQQLSIVQNGSQSATQPRQLIKMQNCNKDTALHVAIGLNRRRIVMLLLSQINGGRDLIIIRNMNGETPVDVALRKNNIEILAVIQQFVPNMASTPILPAQHQASLPVARRNSSSMMIASPGVFNANTNIGNCPTPSSISSLHYPAPVHPNSQQHLALSMSTVPVISAISTPLPFSHNSQTFIPSLSSTNQNIAASLTSLQFSNLSIANSSQRPPTSLYTFTPNNQTSFDFHHQQLPIQHNQQFSPFYHQNSQNHVMLARPSLITNESSIEPPINSVSNAGQFASLARAVPSSVNFSQINQSQESISSILTSGSGMISGNGGILKSNMKTKDSTLTLANNSNNNNNNNNHQAHLHPDNEANMEENEKTQKKASLKRKSFLANWISKKKESKGRDSANKSNVMETSTMNDPTPTVSVARGQQISPQNSTLEPQQQQQFHISPSMPSTSSMTVLNLLSSGQSEAAASTAMLMQNAAPLPPPPPASKSVSFANKTFIQPIPNRMDSVNTDLQSDTSTLKLKSAGNSNIAYLNDSASATSIISSQSPEHQNLTASNVFTAAQLSLQHAAAPPPPFALNSNSVNTIGTLPTPTALNTVALQQMQQPGGIFQAQTNSQMHTPVAPMLPGRHHNAISCNCHQKALQIREKLPPNIKSSQYAAAPMATSCINHGYIDYHGPLLLKAGGSQDNLKQPRRSIIKQQQQQQQQQPIKETNTTMTAAGSPNSQSIMAAAALATNHSNQPTSGGQFAIAEMIGANSYHVNDPLRILDNIRPQVYDENHRKSKKHSIDNLNTDTEDENQSEDWDGRFEASAKKAADNGALFRTRSDESLNKSDHKAKLDEERIRMALTGMNLGEGPSKIKGRNKNDKKSKIIHPQSPVKGRKSANNTTQQPQQQSNSNECHLLWTQYKQMKNQQQLQQNQLQKNGGEKMAAPEETDAYEAIYVPEDDGKPLAFGRDKTTPIFEGPKLSF